MKLALAGTQFHANFPTAVSLQLVSRRCRAKTNVPTNIFAFAKSRSFKENLIPLRGLHRSTRVRNIVGILNVYLPLHFFWKFIFISWKEISRRESRGFARIGRKEGMHFFFRIPSIPDFYSRRICYAVSRFIHTPTSNSRTSDLKNQEKQRFFLCNYVHPNVCMCIPKAVGIGGGSPSITTVLSRGLRGG